MVPEFPWLAAAIWQEGWGGLGNHGDVPEYVKSHQGFYLDYLAPG